MAARLPSLVPLEGSARLANGDGFNDKSSICWTLVSRSYSPFHKSIALKLGLINVSISVTDNI